MSSEGRDAQASSSTVCVLIILENFVIFDSPLHSVEFGFQAEVPVYDAVEEDESDYQKANTGEQVEEVCLKRERFLSKRTTLRT